MIFKPVKNLAPRHLTAEQIDLEMLAVAGLGIAFHAKPVVRESAEQSISTLGLDSILYLMGIRDREAGRI